MLSEASKHIPTFTIFLEIWLLIWETRRQGPKSVDSLIVWEGWQLCPSSIQPHLLNTPPLNTHGTLHMKFMDPRKIFKFAVRVQNLTFHWKHNLHKGSGVVCCCCWLIVVIFLYSPNFVIISTRQYHLPLFYLSSHSKDYALMIAKMKLICPSTYDRARQVELKSYKKSSLSCWKLNFKFSI